ncbi:unnamed protein product [Phytophthora fragariaefolia]|uniref:Unnamed protein product n=1 Tax=Phytophthora fragariaefolia TaxID=1490495 RepID=A0A9W6X7T6_9STRA|nr:unnamed protein product [Phytophthora fragariaefolia]
MKNNFCEDEAKHTGIVYRLFGVPFPTSWLSAFNVHFQGAFGQPDSSTGDGNRALKRQDFPLLSYWKSILGSYEVLFVELYLHTGCSKSRLPTIDPLAPISIIRQMTSLVELISLVESNNDQSKHQEHDNWFKNQWMLLTKQPA